MFISKDNKRLKLRLMLLIWILIMVFSVYGCRHGGENEANLHGENDYDFAKELLIETDSLDNSDGHL